MYRRLYKDAQQLPEQLPQELCRRSARENVSKAWAESWVVESFVAQVAIAVNEHDHLLAYC